MASRTFTINQDGSSRTFTVNTGVGPQGPAGTAGTTTWSGLTGEANHIPFDTTPTAVPTTNGTLSWNADDDCLEYAVTGGTISVGKETFDYYTNLSGVTMVDGDIVSIVGATGNRTAVDLTDATDATSAANVIGMVTQGAANNGTVRVTKTGSVHSLNTNGLTEGGTIYVDPLNPGKWTMTRPERPNHVVSIGVVQVAHAVNGVADVVPNHQCRTAADITDPENLDVFKRTDDRLGKFRNLMYSRNQPHVCFIGDSMLGTAINYGLFKNFRQEFGNGGLGLAYGATSAGASITYDACEKWINGETYTVPLNGEVLFNGGGASIPVVANIMRVYYIVQPGGGKFKIQYEKNSGAWTDVPGFESVDTNGTLAGAVASYTFSTSLIDNYRIKVVGLGNGSGGAATVNPSIVGCSIINSLTIEGILTRITNSSSSSPDNNIGASTTTPRVITDPIFAALGCNLILMSNLDGATGNETYLPTLMDNVNAGLASAGTPVVPSWILIGPPPGISTESDAANVAQADVMRTIAETRNESFFDNRVWALPLASAISNGYMLADNVHYQAPAVPQWASLLFSDFALHDLPNTYEANTHSLKFPTGAQITNVPTTTNNSPGVLLRGNLAIGSPPGSTTAGILTLQDQLGPTTGSDSISLYYSGNIFHMVTVGSGGMMFSSGGTGQFFYEFYATTETPRMSFGSSTNPAKSIILGKSEASATGNRTASFAQGTVKFAAGSSTPIVVTNTLATTTGNVLAQVYGTDATLTGVRITRASGSFTITPNAAATAETTVGWFVLP